MSCFALVTLIKTNRPTIPMFEAKLTHSNLFMNSIECLCNTLQYMIFRIKVTVTICSIFVSKQTK